MSLPWHLYFMAAVYFLAGLNHFRNSGIYLKIIPPYFPKPELINGIAGIAEILLAVFLCVPKCTSAAAWGIIILLIAIFPANLYMYQNEKASLGLPKWVRLARLPFQLALLSWAFLYTKY